MVDGRTYQRDTLCSTYSYEGSYMTVLRGDDIHLYLIIYSNSITCMWIVVMRTVILSNNERYTDGHC